MHEDLAAICRGLTDANLGSICYGGQRSLGAKKRECLCKAIELVRKLNLDLAPNTSDTENTRQLLIQAAKEAWHAIEDPVLYNLSVNMPKRVDAVITAWAGLLNLEKS
jgi:hypothetical protein